jgi:diacylglycerol O-acyltransferase
MVRPEERPMADREPLRAVDSAWLRMDRPGTTADIVALLAFARRLPLEEILRVVETRLLSVERFRQRIAGAETLEGPAWEPDPEFAISRHVAHVALPGAGPEELRALVGAVATEPLDASRPLWRMVLADLPGAGSALVVKLHHCLGDGYALVAVLLSLADEPPADAPPPRAGSSFRDVSLRHGLGQALGLGVGLGLENVARAVALGRDAVDVGRSLVRMALLPRDPPTVLARTPTGVRRAAWTPAFPLPRLRAAAHARGATVNDLVVAAIAGAVRGSLAAVGEPVDRLEVRALVPVNLRAGRPDPSRPEALGNQFGLVYLDLPVHLGAAADRLAEVRARVAVLKRSPDAVASYGVLAALGLLPPSLHRLGADFFARKASLVLTNVPGPRRALHLAGRRLGQMMFWVPHPSTLGLGVSILSYAGEVRVGVRADEAVVLDPADLAGRLEPELAALGMAAAPAAVRRPKRRGHRAHAHAHEHAHAHAP